MLFSSESLVCTSLDIGLQPSTEEIHTRVDFIRSCWEWHHASCPAFLLGVASCLMSRVLLVLTVHGDWQIQFWGRVEVMSEWR